MKVDKSWMPTLAILFALATTSMAAPPDLTVGGVPNESPALTFNLGPTGLRGWTYHVKQDTSESRQILVTAVDTGSPADGTLAVDDVILGANGTGASPVNFSADARKSLAYAIADAEARATPTLQLLRWRSGSTTLVTITLQNLGAYTATAPYNCPKSAAILQNGLQYVYNNETAGRYSFGAITLLATGNATYETKAQTEAHALIPTQSTMTQMMSDDPDTSSMITWQRGHTLVFLAEYYLATNDALVLPAIEAYAVNIAKNQSLFGTVGHKYAQKNADGSANGPMGGVYGVVNSAGMPCFLGILLAKECGLTNPELDPAIEASSRFFAYYSGKGAIPYGEHEPYLAHESNGKCGLGALYFSLQNNRVDEGKFFAQMATASTNERELGHTGSWFNYLWAPLGAAAGGEEAAAAYFGRISWILDLNRCWDGKFQYDCLNGEGPNSGSSYHDFRMSTAALLTYALPHRKLRITGKNHVSARYLSTADVAEAIQSGDYDADSRSDSQLISDLDNWSPKVRKQAAQELGTRSISTTELNQITAIANNTAGSSRLRAGACAALGEIGNSSSAAPLAALLTDSDNYVRYSAGDAMRYLPRSANLAHLNTILAAAASNAAPLYPMIEEDPLQFAHAKLGMLLFYSWSAFGPKGILWDSVNGVDRGLLYPAIRAVAKTPVGLSRGTLERTYDNLDYADVLALSGTIVDAVVTRAPADKMFSNGVRRGGVAALQKHGIAEGVLAAMAFAADEEGGRRREGLEGIGTFGGGVHTVEPDPNAIGFLTSYLSIAEVASTAQASLDAINGDTSPTPLTALKSIQSATADNPTLDQPSSSTVLRVSATDHAQGDSIYTWKKVSGPGGVTFTPNGTAAADSTVQFDGTVGAYEFKVTMSDSRELTEAYETVLVTVVNGSGPDATPPTLTSTDIVDDQSGGPIYETTTVLYTVTFNEPMNGSTIGTNDFENGGSPAATINSVVTTSDPAVFEVSVTPGGTGTLQLQVKSGADLEDLASNALNTASAIADNTTITVTAAPQAASILAFTEGNGSGGGGDKTIATAYDASAADKLVVVLGGEHGFPGNTGGVFYSVTYGGVTLTEAVQEEAGVPTLAIFYLDNPGAAGDIVVNQENHNESLYVIYQLVGTAAGVGSTSKATANSVNLTTTAGNAIVIAGILNAGPDGGNGAPNMTADAPLTEDTVTDLEGGSRYVSMSTGSVTVATPSLVTYSFSNAGGTDLLAIAAVEFFAGSAPPDTTPPTLAATDIVDDQGGVNVGVGTLVTYTVTFNEDIDETTVEAGDFVNAGSSAITIGTITETSPGLFSVEITPTDVGTLQLEVSAGAVITDVAGNDLNTSASISDDTTLTVLSVVTVPNVVGLAQASAESAITSAGLSVGNVTTATSGSVPAGDVISQTPAGGSSTPSGASVNLVVSLGVGSGNPLKVFILAGQSNMEGHGEMNPVGTQGTLEYLVSNDSANYGHLKNGANWITRDDVWMWYKRGGTTLLTGNLTAGYGASSDTIGPELQFGHVLGDLNGDQILIIKTAWGGKSLAVDFRPPTSGWSINPPTAAGHEGYYYQEMMNYVNDVLTNLPTYFPEYNATNGYELAGFGWHQGWNDRVNQADNDEYEVNMVNFINDVRSDLGVSGLPFVIATTGMSGWSETHPRALSLMAAQLAMEDFTQYPTFNGNVAVVETRGFWRDTLVSPANQNYHWNRNAETYCLIGEAMAQEMQTLILSSGDFAAYIANPTWGLAVDDQDPEDDPDGDGLSNALEAWLGTHPGQANQFITSITSTATTVTFTHPQNATPPTDLTGYYQWSPNLINWYAGNGVDGPAGGLTLTFVPNTNGAVTTVTATASEAFGRIFLRAGVNQN